MREQAKHTSIAPSDRIKRLLSFGERLLRSEEVSSFHFLIIFRIHTTALASLKNCFIYHKCVERYH